MGLETANQAPLGRIDVSALAPRPDVVVEPNATNAILAAFNNGVSNANLVTDRARMAPAQNAAVAEAIDPQLVEARKQSVLAGAAHAKTQAEAAQLALTQAKLEAQMPKQIHEMQLQLAKNEWQVQPTDMNQWTMDDSKEVVRRWGVSEKWKAEAARVAAELSLAKPQEVVSERGTELVPVSKNTGAPLDTNRVTEAEKFLTMFPNPKQYDAGGQPPAPSLFSDTAPGQTAAPGGNEPMIPLPGDRGRLAPVVPGAAPAAQPAGAGGFLIKPPAPVPEKAATENQVKAGMATARFISADQILQNLQKAGFDPGAVGNWAQELLVGPLKAFKTADKREYDAAKDAWIQGLLRLESGAAISAKEQSWYERTFFPTGMEPANVQKIKAGLRADVEKLANEVAKSGKLNVSELLNVRAQGDQMASGAPGAGAAPASNKPISVSGVGTGYLDVSDPSNPRFVITQSGAAPASTIYNPPPKLGSSKISVEPKRPGNRLK